MWTESFGSAATYAEPTSRLFPGYAGYGSSLYVQGGSTFFFASDHSLYDMWRYDLQLLQWFRLSALNNFPGARELQTLSATDSRDEMFMFGGCKGNILTDECVPVQDSFYSYNVTRDQWTFIEGPTGTGPMPIPRYGHVAGQFPSGTLLVFGGIVSQSDVLEQSIANRTTWLYSPVSRLWTSLPDLIPRPPRVWLACSFTIKDKVCFFGVSTQ